jgi:GxxExxY protein
MDNAPTNELTSKIIGCAMKVHTKLGFGFVESVYENSLAHELRKNGFRVGQQIPIKVFYDGIVVGDFVADLIIDDEIILELKAVQNLNPLHEVQLVNYLNATGKETGLLLNFGARSVEIKRKFRRPRPESSSSGFTGIVGLFAVLAGKLLGHF